MENCYLCGDEATISCAKCFQPICRVHRTTAKEMHKRRIIAFGIALGFVLVAWALGMFWILSL